MAEVRVLDFTNVDHSSWAPVDLTPILSGDLDKLNPPPSVLIYDENLCLFYRGKVHMVFGDRESLKTWLLLVACAQEVRAGRHVVYLDFEDTAMGIVGRLLALGCKPKTIVQHFHYVSPSGPMEQTDLEQVAYPASLVVVDGVTEAMEMYGLSPERGVEVARFYRLLVRPLVQLSSGPAVVLIDHVTHSEKTRGRPIGSQHKLAGTTGASYEMKKLSLFAPGRTGRTKLVYERDRPGRVAQHAGAGKHVADLVLNSIDGRITYSFEPPETRADGPSDAHTAPGFEPTALMEKISRYLEKLPPDSPGLSKNAVETAMGGKRQYVRTALELLVARGFVVPKPTRGTHYHRSVRPFRVAPTRETTK
jgi:hypothetical protein